MEKIWKSPRKIDEEVRKYKHDRFESLMQDAGTDEQKRKLAFVALREEFVSKDMTDEETKEQVG